MSARKLKAWEAAGLIDTATASRIREWEAQHSRPLGLWAVIGIAALAIGLGLISVVAANWDAIPGEVRLSIHFALMAGTIAFLWFGEGELANRQPWLHEAVLFILGMLGMTFLGHVGQVYQTSSPLWQPLLLWLLLFAPLLLARGLSWLIAALVMVPLVIAVWNYAWSVEDSHSRLTETGAMIRMATAVSAPVLAAALAAWLRKMSEREPFWRRLEQLALAYGIGGTSLLAIVSAFDRWPDDHDAGLILNALSIMALFALVTALLVNGAQRADSNRAQASILAGAALAVVLAFPLSGSQLAAGLLFLAFWAGIAAASLYAGWRGVFQIAVGVIAVRLVILSFELAEDLLTSGAGLIASGLLILGVAWGAVRVSKRFAPVVEASP